MMLANELKKLQSSELRYTVENKLKNFSSFKNKSNNEWFSELCFCLLTANSKAKTAIAIQKELGHEGFMHKTLKEVTECIRRNKHRFHNTKAKFIVGAREFVNIKDVLRTWLVITPMTPQAFDLIIELKDVSPCLIWPEAETEVI